MKIAFFIGSVDISGGTYVIYQHAQHARRCGHEVTMVVLYPFSNLQMGWHPACEELRFLPVDEAKGERFDLAIATWWKTATELHSITADRYAYFVQSIESRFYPEREGPLRDLVDRTYDLGLPTITEATWIKQHLATSHDCQASLVRNGIRKDLYTPDGPKLDKQRRGFRLLIEGPFGVPFKNVGTSLRLARRSRASSVWLLTSTSMHPWYPGVERVNSRVPIESVPAIYRSCDAILKLSTVEGMFGPPLEMFHCGGTAIVYDVTGHDEYIENGKNAIVIPSGSESRVIEAINLLSSDQSLLSHLKEEAAKTAMAWPDWHESSSAFVDTLEAIVETRTPSRDEIAEGNQNSMAIYVPDEEERLAKVASLARDKTYRKRSIEYSQRLIDRCIPERFVKHWNLLRESL